MHKSFKNTSQSGRLERAYHRDQKLLSLNVTIEMILNLQRKDNNQRKSRAILKKIILSSNHSLEDRYFQTLYFTS